jgi:hypothetical protein
MPEDLRVLQFAVREIDTGVPLCIVEATTHAEAYQRAGLLLRLGLIAGDYGVEQLENRLVQTLCYVNAFFQPGAVGHLDGATGSTGTAIEH